MKSSRSIPPKNTRRNARRLMSESSDDSDIIDSSNDQMDSARAEKVFSHRRPQKYMSNINAITNTSVHIQPDRTLFRVSDSDSSYSDVSLRNSMIDKNTFEHKKVLLKNDQILHDIIDDEHITNYSDNSENETSFKPSKNDLHKYRNILQSSDEDESEIYNLKKLNATSTIEISDDSDDEFTNKSNQSLIENTSANESFFITPNKLKNKPRLIFDSSEESDNELETSIGSKSKSDVDVINSSIELCLPPIKDLSLIEASDSDDISFHCKSTIASSNQKRPFLDDLKLINMTNIINNPVCQSSILEESKESSFKNVTNENKIEVITLDDDSFETTNVSSTNDQLPLIDVLNTNEYGKKSLISTKNEYENKTSISSKDHINTTKEMHNSDFESLKLEKLKLEEILNRFKKNIDNMKNTMKITNLHLLPDGGLKLKKAILKEENALKDTEVQLKNVLEKLKGFSNIQFSNAILTKKAADNIDIKAMGDKALNTYRGQQTMTLDVLHSLHKSLETCPSPDILTDDPIGLKIKLMPHQNYAIAWLLWRESQKPHGGILADDMGLGKTLTMISLILKASEIEKKGDIDTNSINGGTLIICPSSLMSQWQNEIKTKLQPKKLDVIQHYGPNRDNSARRLARKDIVITTYHVVMWDQKSHQNTSPLFQIKWKRIILDEAHTIRNYRSQTSIAVCALSGINRWALSGTPIHNKEADFYALLKFIRCRPFDDWAVWKRWIGNNDQAGKNRLSLLVKTLMLRRTKLELNEIDTFKLPNKSFHVINIDLFKEEKEAYEKVLQFSSSLFATYLYEKAKKENAIDRNFPVNNKIKYLHQQDLSDDIFKDHPELDKLFKQLKNKTNIQAHHILVLLLRLRQLCCHPCLMKNMLESETLKVDGIPDVGDLDLVDHMSRMSIGIPSIENHTLTNSNPIFNDSWVSSKIKAVCDMIKEKVLHTSDKAIVVSQWPSMLHLINNQLSQNKVKTEMFSGAVPVLLRNKIVQDFNNSKGDPKILLLSLTAGGVGLNLVAANHLFLVDIHWNPQLEAQACDRIYRVGQTKPVNIYKFICSNTIESSIQTIQSHKLEIANNLFGGCNKVEGTKITLDDLKVIFNINPNYK